MLKSDILILIQKKNTNLNLNILTNALVSISHVLKVFTAEATNSF